MSVHSGPRAEWWFGKRTNKPAGTVVGEDGQDREGIISQSGRFFSLDWWYGSSRGPGHFMERDGEGKFGDEAGRRRRSIWGGQRSGELGRRKVSAADRKRQEQHDYAVYLHERFQAAERATNGNMLTKAGKARGINPRDFFDVDARRRPGMKWASDELKAWMGDGSAAAGTKGARGGILSATKYRQQTRERAAA